ncbi:MAG: DUF2071 domain-containing protein [Planctomycetaceae bacterium]
MHESFARVDHRPWEIPSGPWTWRQSWKELLFAHWPVPAASLRSLVPEELTIQEYDGTSWVGVVPFRMTGVMRRPFPDLPGVSAFPELNVRLYVEYEGKPGVWFLSLDASSRLAVWGAKTFFHLPYHHARITHQPTGQGFAFHSDRLDDVRRHNDNPPSICFDATYQPVGSSFEAAPGTLEEFLVERYCLYAQSKRGELYRAHVHHLPWPLFRAEGEVRAEALLATHGLQVEGDPVLHYSPGVNVVVWPLERLSH